VASKMSELQDALNRYGETSIQNYKIIHPVGEKIIEGFGVYLGDSGCVFGVPPPEIGKMTVATIATHNSAAIARRKYRKMTVALNRNFAGSVPNRNR
jgi:hypothetical protein